jgi:class 3 adenylate cyclase
VVGRYAGVVEKFIGDAIMAVWGTPAATEADAERAVRAALDLVAAAGQLGEEVVHRGRRRGRGW